MYKILNIVKYTYLEFYRKKIFVNIFLMSFLILAVAYIASEFSYGVPEKVALDFGVGVAHLSSIVIAIFLGATLISSEIESRTIYMILSKPLTRFQFFIGKVAGLSIVLFINIIMLMTVAAMVYFFIGELSLDLYPWIILLTCLEALVMLLVVVFFSLFTNRILAVMYSLFFLILSYAISITKELIQLKNSPVMSKVVEYVSYILPDFNKVNLRSFLLYSEHVSMESVLQGTLSISLYIIFLTFICVLLFNKKEIT